MSVAVESAPIKRIAIAATEDGDGPKPASKASSRERAGSANSNVMHLLLNCFADENQSTRLSPLSSAGRR